SKQMEEEFPDEKEDEEFPDEIKKKVMSLKEFVLSIQHRTPKRQLKEIPDPVPLLSLESPIQVYKAREQTAVKLTPGVDVKKHLGTAEDFSSSLCWFQAGKTETEDLVICALPSLRLFLWDGKCWEGAEGECWEEYGYLAKKGCTMIC